MTLIVGMSDAKSSADPREVLATYSLGSCVGVALHDPVAAVAGLLHFQLPASCADPLRAADRPCMFADTGMAYLVRELERQGAVPSRLRVRLAGGAQMLNDASFFNIGRRNIAAIRKVLWGLGLFIESEHLGGSVPRSLFLNVSDGALAIRSNGRVVAA